MQNADLIDDLPVSLGPIKCRCIVDCPDGLYNSTCGPLQPYAKCFKKLFLNENGEEEIRAGCLASTENQIDQCNKLADPSFATATDVQCCNNGSLCNDHLIMRLPTFEYDDDDAESKATGESANISLVVLTTVICFCAFFGTIIVVYFIRARRKEAARKRQIEIENRHAACPVFYPETRRGYGRGRHRAMDVVLNDLSGLAATTSGQGIPLLVQRTISKQIEIVDEIGQGRYGSVMLGKWRDEYVALKIFNPKDKESWDRETEIYQTVIMRHDNVLGFIAADISGTNNWKQLYLITEYHPNGSLFRYLHDHVLEVTDALRLAFSACSGLAYLHTQITGTQGKPAIAHRDVKSKNFLVKNDGQCCVADMGLAVKYSSSIGKVNLGSYENSGRTGTLRYMAPEVITGSFHPDSFDAFKAADVYGFALVMWEIANRTRVKDKVNDYQLPYYDYLSQEPSLEEVKKVVVTGKVRPDIMVEWEQHDILSVYASTMQEAWVGRYESRLGMLRIRKTLKLLLANDHKVAESSGSSFESDRKFSITSTNPSTDPDPESIIISPARGQRLSQFEI